MKPHSTSLSWALASAARLSSSANETGAFFGLRRLAAMDVPDRIGQPLLGILARIGGEELRIFVDGPRDHVEIEPLGLARALYM